MNEHRSLDNQCPISSIQRQFTRAFISTNDLKQCLAYLNAFEKTSDDWVRRGLLTAAVIAYARPFSGNERHELAAQTPPIKLQRLLTRDQKTLHDRLRDLRNKAIAHSDYELNPVEPKEFHEKSFLVKAPLYDLLAFSVQRRNFGR